VFAFTPPPGATESDDIGFVQSSGSGSSSVSGDPGTDVDLPEGYLTPTYVLPGFHTDSVGNSQGDDGSESVDFLLRSDSDAYISVEERRAQSELQSALKLGDNFELRGQSAWLQDVDGLLKLAWHEDDLVIYIIARGVSRDDVLRFAESMVESGGEGIAPVVVDATAESDHP
jgi:hypothetical protein